MEFLDRTLLRLADPAERAALCPPAVGDRVLHAAFDVRGSAVAPVSGVAIRDVDLVPVGAAPATVVGTLTDSSTGTRHEFNGSLYQGRPAFAAHAVLDLRITTELRRVRTSIEKVSVRALTGLADRATVDARIVAEDGALPAGTVDLDRRRYQALKSNLRDRFALPAEVDIDDLAGRLGGTDFASLTAAVSAPHHLADVAVELVEDGTLPSAIETHRVVAAVLIEPYPFNNLVETLERVRVGAEALAASVAQAPPPSGMGARSQLPFIVVFPEHALDDDDLPSPRGANPNGAAARRSARLRELQTRLTRTGVALAPVAGD